MCIRDRTLRAQTGYEDIKIIVVVPFIGYDSKWPDPVSYTHLDVYKRQDEYLSGNERRKLRQAQRAAQQDQIGRAHV